MATTINRAHLTTKPHAPGNDPRADARATGICFVAHTSFGELAGGTSGDIGGIQRQQSFMARWLAERGYRVSFLTWDEGQPDEVVLDGVRVFKMCRRSQGMPGLRFFYPRWTSLIRALRRADADLYYHNSAEYVTGQVAAWCRRHGRKFVYSVASDPACDGRMPLMDTLRERVLYRHGVRAADRVIVQTEKQRKMLAEGFGRDSVVIPMPCPGPHSDEYVAPAPPNGNPRVLWVGRIAEMKRLELLLDVAERMPEIQFDVAGAPDTETAYTRAVLARGRTIKNVTLHGRVAREAIPDLYRRAACLCCTSSYEGFPNTFLEAWSYGVPIVSTYDPDALIARFNLGAATADASGVAASLAGLIASPQRWRDASGNARSYYQSNHTPSAAMSRFERLFLEVLDRPETHRITPLPSELA